MKKELIQLIKDNINNIDVKDIYAFDLYLEYLNDNLFEPTITFGYNTLENVKNMCQETDEDEAKWNYAYWLQNEIFVFGIDETKSIVKNWFLENNFGYMSYDEFFSNEIDTDLCEKVDEKIKQEMIYAVQEIHKSNIIQDKFDNEIPIIIHELEYYDNIAKINEEANPKNLIFEFSKFCKGDY